MARKKVGGRVVEDRRGPRVAMVNPATLGHKVLVRLASELQRVFFEDDDGKPDFGKIGWPPEVDEDSMRLILEDAGLDRVVVNGKVMDASDAEELLRRRERDEGEEED